MPNPHSTYNFGVAFVVSLLFASRLVLASELDFPPAGSADYRSGFCAGWKAAVDDSQSNRDHFMRMDLDFKFETNAEALERIYASSWEAQHKDGNLIHRLLALERDAVDLYVVLPQTKCVP